jgi:hypothetical protein
MSNVTTAALFAKATPRGQWPGTPQELPLLLSEQQFAHLIGRCLRTVQKNRRKQKGWPPHQRIGRSIMYSRDVVLAHYGLRGS